MKITFLDKATLGDDISLDKFKEFGEVEIYDTTSPSQTFERIKDADIIVTNKVVIDKQMMQNSKLSLICVAATGMNNIDLEAANELGIAVKNVAGYSTPSVVQTTFAMALYLIGRLKYFDDYTSSGEWCESEIFTHLKVPYHDLEGKRWGIIGLGTIGKEVAKVATVFGCEVVYYSTSGENRDNTYPSLSLDELLKTSDIISIHAPLNENTKGLIDREKLKLLKKGAIILNLGRGGIIVEKELALSIDEDGIFAGVDVLEGEPMEREHPLLKVKHKERLIITPHIAWASVESRRRLVDEIYENIKGEVK